MTDASHALPEQNIALAVSAEVPGEAQASTGALESPVHRADAATIGRFLLLRKLGEGGMGEVFSAYDEQLDRRVAIKLLHASYASEEGRKRMLREAQALARLAHPNVVTVYEVGEVDGDVFVVMEHIEGKTLADWQAEAPRSAHEIIEVYLMAGRGLSAVHAAGMMHRDFKPMNVMIDKAGRVRIVDFGLAHARGTVIPAEGERKSSSRVLESPLTEDGGIVGTPAYMSPEQFMGEPLDARTDQFSYCVSLYQSLYGAHPFRSEKPGAVIVPALAGHAKPPPSRNDVPERIAGALLRGLSRDPALRYETMDALLEILGKEPAPDPSQQGKERRIFILITLGTFVASLLKYGLVPAKSVGIWEQLLFTTVAVLAVIGSGIYAFRNTLVRNPFHRSRMLVLLNVGLVVTLSRIIGSIRAEAPTTIAVRDLFLTLMSLSVAVIWLTPRLWYLWLAIALAFLGIWGVTFFPEHIALITSIAINSTFVLTFVAWWRSAKFAPPVQGARARSTT